MTRKEYLKEYYLNNKDKAKEYYLDNKENLKQLSRLYRLNNKDKVKETRRLSYLNNIDNIKEYTKQYYFKNKQTIDKNVRKYRLNNKEKIKEYNKLYRFNKPHIQIASSAKRRATQLRAIPIFANPEKIKLIYKNCPKGYHVDHIVPLQGKNVCGLHVEWNLQYLTAHANHTKSNNLN
jgi:hypothetical protein